MTSHPEHVHVHGICSAVGMAFGIAIAALLAIRQRHGGAERMGPAMFIDVVARVW